jgi:hypothetical protein
MWRGLRAGSIKGRNLGRTRGALVSEARAAMLKTDTCKHRWQSTGRFSMPLERLVVGDGLILATTPPLT